jgi:hypothetical protein
VHVPNLMTDAERQALIERYTQGHQTVLAALESAGLPVNL